MWRFVNAMVYYGLTLKAGDFGSSRYISIAMVGLVEIPADLVALYCMDRFVSLVIMHMAALLIRTIIDRFI